MGSPAPLVIGPTGGPAPTFPPPSGRSCCPSGVRLSLSNGLYCLASCRSSCFVLRPLVASCALYYGPVWSISAPCGCVWPFLSVSLAFISSILALVCPWWYVCTPWAFFVAPASSCGFLWWSCCFFLSSGVPVCLFPGFSLSGWGFVSLWAFSSACGSPALSCGLSFVWSLVSGPGLVVTRLRFRSLASFFLPLLLMRSMLDPVQSPPAL